MTGLQRRGLLRAGFLLVVAAGVRAQPAARASEAVDLQGSALQAHRVLTAQDLAALPPEMIGTFSESRGTPGNEQRSTVRGARLAALIERQGFTATAKENWKNLLVTVTATDGYRAQFTWVELSNTPVGPGVLLVFERDGQPLDAREGRIALLSTVDQKLGPRHVRNVERIEVSAVP